MELDLRQVFNAILYVVRTGCQWQNLPRDVLECAEVVPLGLSVVMRTSAAKRVLDQDTRRKRAP